jgi:hypothetical protein
MCTSIIQNTYPNTVGGEVLLSIYSHCESCHKNKKSKPPPTSIDYNALRLSA